MLQLHSNDRRSKTLYSRTASAKLRDWREEAIAAYSRAEREDIDGLRQELASRILELTGCAVKPGSVYVDRGTRTATASAAGGLFRLRGGELLLVRPCVYCGVRRFESSQVRDLADLGHALSVWEPRCEGCGLEDED